jgi:hypothetical protein
LEKEKHQAKKWLRKLPMEKASFYFSSYNLFTFLDTVYLANEKVSISEVEYTWTTMRNQFTVGERMHTDTRGVFMG